MTGWAGGHEQVRITPSFVLSPPSTSTDAKSEQEAHDNIDKSDINSGINSNSNSNSVDSKNIIVGSIAKSQYEEHQHLIEQLHKEKLQQIERIVSEGRKKEDDAAIALAAAAADAAASSRHHINVGKIPETRRLPRNEHAREHLHELKPKVKGDDEVKALPSEVKERDRSKERKLDLEEAFLGSFVYYIFILFSLIVFFTFHSFI